MKVLQNRNRLADTEKTLVITKGDREGERDKLGVWN